MSEILFHSDLSNFKSILECYNLKVGFYDVNILSRNTCCCRLHLEWPFKANILMAHGTVHYYEISKLYLVWFRGRKLGYQGCIL